MEEKERKELKDKQVARALTEMKSKVASEITIAGKLLHPF
jgi:hypothetical protein